LGLVISGGSWSQGDVEPLHALLLQLLEELSGLRQAGLLGLLGGQEEVVLQCRSPLALVHEAVVGLAPPARGAGDGADLEVILILCHVIIGGRWGQGAGIPVHHRRGVEGPG